MKKIGLFLLVAFICTSFAWAAAGTSTGANDIIKTVKYKDNVYTFKFNGSYDTLDLSTAGYYANISLKQLGNRVVDFWPVVCPHGAVVIWKLKANNYDTFNYLYSMINYKDASIHSTGYMLIGKYPIKDIEVKALDKGAKVTLTSANASKVFDLFFKGQHKEI